MILLDGLEVLMVPRQVFILFSSAFSQSIFKNGCFRIEMNSSFSSCYPGTINFFLLHIILVQNNLCGKELNKFRPPNSSDNLSAFSSV